MKTIKSRIVFISMAVFLVTMVCLIWVYIFYLGDKVMVQSRAELVGQAQYYAEQLSDESTNASGILEGFRDFIESSGGENDAQIQEAIDEMFAANLDYMNIYYGTTEGKFIHANNGGTLPSDYDPRTRTWYQAAIDADSCVVGDPYMAASTKEMCATISLPVYIDGQLTGVVGVDIPVQHIIDTVNNISFSEGVYAFLIDADGNFITHPNTDFQPTTDKSVSVEETIPVVYKALSEGRFNELFRGKNYDGKDYFFALAEMPGTGWTLATVVPIKTARLSLHWSFVNTAILAVVLMFICAFIFKHIVKKEIGPIDALIPVAKQISAGDFSTQIEKSEKTDEIATLQNSFADMISNMKNVIDQQKKTLSEMAEGNLSVPDMEEFPGEYNKIANQINSIKATLNALIVEIQFAAINVQSTASSQIDTTNTEEMLAVFDELSAEANELMDKANKFITTVQ